MPKLKIFPLEKSIEIDSNIDLREALLKQDIHLKSSCGGHASCGQCIIKVRYGEDNISPPTAAEIKFLGNVFHITRERLACQVMVEGPVEIDITGHDIDSMNASLEKKLSRGRVVVKKKAVLDEENRAKEEEERVLEEQRSVKGSEKITSGGKKRPTLFRTDNLEEKYKKKDK